jgi:protein-disulfide isomerase-like protein with CxxC motif
VKQLSITFDYLCPFARILNETLIVAKEDGAPFEVDFLPFSLSQVHLSDGDAPVWETTPRRSGVLALEWGLAVRDQFPDRFPAAHLALFSARHDHGHDLNDPRVLRDAVAGAGLAAGEVEEIVAGGAPAKALRDDHTALVEEHQVFGVPTIIAGDRAVFIRLMDRTLDPATARTTVDRLLEMIVAWPALNEFKATRIPR